MSDKKISLIEWLGLRTDIVRPETKLLGTILGIGISSLVALTFCTTFVLFAVLIGSIFSPDDGADVRNIGVVLIAAIGFPFLAWRSWAAFRQSETAQQGLITDRIATAVENLAAEKKISFRARNVHWVREFAGQELREGFTQKWGSERDLKHQLPPEISGLTETEIDEYVHFGKWETISETTPNIERRIGGIYSLERIIHDSPRDFPRIAELLCAYVRENSPVSCAIQEPGNLNSSMPKTNGRLLKKIELPLGKIQTPPAKNSSGIRSVKPNESLKLLRTWAQTLPRLRNDIQAALNVLGKPENVRNWEIPQGPDMQDDCRTRFDLSYCNLQRANLAGLVLQDFLFRHSNFHGAYANKCKLDFSNFRDTEMRTLEFTSISVRCTYFRRSKADFSKLFQCGDMAGSLMRNLNFSDIDLSKEQLSDVLALDTLNTASGVRPRFWTEVLGSAKDQKKRNWEETKVIWHTWQVEQGYRTPAQGE